MLIKELSTNYKKALDDYLKLNKVKKNVNLEELYYSNEHYIGAFENGKLVGYINTEGLCLSFNPKIEKKQFKINEINAKSARTFIYLCSFILGTKRRVKINKEYLNTIQRVNKIFNYALKVECNDKKNIEVECADYSKVPEKYRLIYYIHKNEKYIDETAFERIFDDLNIIERANIITNNSYLYRKIIYQHNRELLNMLNGSFKVRIKFEKQLSYNSIVKYCFELENNSYKEDNSKSMKSLGKFYEHYGNTVYYSHIIQEDKKYENMEVSHYRWLIKKWLKSYGRSKSFTNLVISDIYGENIMTVFRETNIYKVFPRNWSNIFNARLKLLQYNKEIMEKWFKFMKYNKLNCLDCYDLLGMNWDQKLMFEQIINITSIIYKNLGKGYADKFFLRLLNEIQNEGKYEKIQIVHDYEMYVKKIIKSIYLTKKAKEIIIDKSFFQQRMYNGYISRLPFINIKSFKKELLKELRKGLSSLIKRNASSKEINNYCNYIAVKIDGYFLESCNIEVNDKKLELFREKMLKHLDTFSLVDMLNRFGKKLTAKIIEEKVKSIFKPKEYEMPLKDIGECVYKILKCKKSKRIKRLYTALNKIKPIHLIFSAEINENEAKLILKELKQRRFKYDSNLEKLSFFSAKIEDKSSPEFLTAGDATICCMSFNSDKIVNYTRNKGFNLINVYYKDKIIANTLIWINKENNKKQLILDNIEVHPNYKKFNNLIGNLLIHVCKDIKEEYDLDEVLQGTTFNDLELFFGERRELIFDGIEIGKNFYTDAHFVGTVHLGKRNINAKYRNSIDNNAYLTTLSF
ncbi:MAG: hypothetical protein ACOCP8_00125 [archaeon]